MSIFIFSLSTFAINGRTTYQAKIVKPDGHPLEASSVNFRFSVLDQTGSCVLYVEDYSSINMTDTGGLISFPLGSGTRAFPTSGTSQTFQNTFDNSITSFACQSVGIYNPNPTDTRKIVMQFNDGAGWQTLPAMSLNAVPYAMFATRSNNSLTLNNKADTAFVEYSSIPTCTASQALQYTGSSFVCVTSGGSSVTSSTVATALGYTPVAPASVTALTSSLSSTDATVASVSSSVYSVSSTVSGLSNTVTSLSNSVAASFASMTSSQWVTSATGIYYGGGNVAIGATSSTDQLLVYNNQDAGTKFRVRNPSSGTAAFAQISADSGVATAYLFAFGASYTTTGRFVAGSALVDGNGTGGLGLSASYPTADMRFYTNAHNERMRLTSLGNLGIGTSSPVTKLDVSGGIRVSMETATCAASFAGTIRYNSGNLEYCNGTSWSALGVAGAGITLLNGSASGSQIFAAGIAGTAFNISSANGVHNFNIPFAASGGVTAGLLSNTDYTTFSNKVSATSAAVNAALGYTAANQTAMATSFAAVTTSTNALATSITANSASLTSLAASMGAITSSQWITSGTNIYNTANNVGIGTVNPTYKLQVSGGAILADGAGGYYQVGTDYSDSNLGKISFHNTSRNWTNQYFAGLAYSNGSGWMALGGGTSLNLFLDSGSSVNYGSHIFRKIGWDGVNRTFTEMMRLDANGNLGVGIATGLNGRVSISNTATTSYALDITNSNTSIGSTNKAVNLNMSAGQVNQTNTGIYIHNTNLSDGSATGLDLNLNARNDVYGLKVNATKYWGGALAGSAMGVYSSVGTDSSIGNSYGGYFTNTASTGTKAYGLYVNANAGATDAAPLVVAAQGSEVFRVSVSGGVGVGIANPTAKLHLAAGTPTNAPLKFASGTLTTSAQSGTMEYDGFNFYLTDSTNQRRAIATGSSAGNIDNATNINSTGNMTLTPNAGTGSVVVASTANSTSTNTGALVVNGGVGIAGNLNVGGVISGASQVKATGFRASQGAPTAADSSTNGYAFGLDGDTGLFSPGSGAANGIVAIYNNNAETMRVQPGAVGIGTSAPTATLDINRPVAPQTSNVKGLNLYSESTFDTTAGNLFNYGAYIVASGTKTAGSNFIYNVGLYVATKGGALPQAAILDATNSGSSLPQSDNSGVQMAGSRLVLDQVNNPMYIHMRRTNTSFSSPTTMNPGDILGGVGFGGFDGASYTLGNSSAQAQIRAVATETWSSVSHGTDLIFATTQNGTANASEKMRLTNSGSLGLGTGSPMGTMEIYATNPVLKIANTSVNSGTNEILFTHIGSTTNQHKSAIFSQAAGSYGQSTLMFATNNLSDGSNVSISDAKLLVNQYVIASASVGIGTTVPSELLHVESASNTSILINTAGNSSTSYLKFGHAGTAKSAIMAPSAGSYGISTGLYFGLNSVTDSSPATTADSKMVILNNGNVGIGALSPSIRLDVRGPKGDPANFTSGTISVNNGGIAALLLGTDDTVTGQEYAWIQSHGSRPIFINKAANNTILNYGGGNVGIATSAPTERLEVSGKVKLTNGFGATNAALVYGNDTDYMFLGAQSGSSNQGAGISIAGASNTQTAAASGGITFVVPNISPAAVIKGYTGYVGIGTSNPEGSLHIVTSQLQTNSPSAGIFLGKSLGADYQIQLSQNGGTPHIDFSRGVNLDYDARISSPVNGAMWLGTTSSSALMALSGLNVGIGTVTPQRTLDVSGSVRHPYLDVSGNNGTTSDRPYIRGVYDHFVLAPAQDRTGGADTNTMYLAYPGDLAAGDTVTTRLQETLFISPTGSAGNGKVSIGSSATPNNKFEVHGGDTFMEGRAYVYTNSGWGALTPTISLAIGDNDTGLNWVSDGVLQIYSNNAPRMHFATTGATGINRTDPTYTLDVAGSFRVTGQAYTDTGAATFTVLSDVRYKDVHGSYERGLDDLLKIGTIRYNYKKENPTGADSTHEYVGVAAQNVQEAIPEAVEKQTAKDGKEFLTVNPSPIIFAMINGFRDMYNKIVKLIDTDARHDREIASLKAENEELKTKVKEFDELKQYICKKDPQAPNCK